MIIGRNVTAPASSHILSNGNRLADSIGATLPAFPPQRAITVGAEMHTSFTGAATVDLALYDVTDYPNDVGAPRVALVTLNIPDSNSFAFHTAEVNIDLSAYAGRTLKPAIGNPTGATTVRVNRVPGGSASTDASGLLPTTWPSTANTSSAEPIIYFETEDIPVEIGSKTGAVDVYYPTAGCRMNTSTTLILPENQRLVEVGAMAHSGGPARTLKVAIRDITSSVNGATLLHTETINVSGSVLTYFNLTDLAVDFSSHAGKLITVSVGEADNTGVRYGKKPGSASTDSSGVFGANWNQTGTDTNQPVVYARFEEFTPTGPSIPAVTDPVEDTIVADMDNPVEVSSIEITSGIRTEVQTNWTSEALAPDDTRFTINPVDRLTLPFLGTATLRFLDNLDALIVDTSINLTAWSGWKATLLDGLTGADIDHPESINQFRTSGTPTVDDQYMWQEITATNVQISNNDRVTFDAPGSFQLYYWDGTNETMSGPHVFEVDETGIVLVRRLRIFHNGKVLDIINSMSGL